MRVLDRIQRALLSDERSIALQHIARRAVVLDADNVCEWYENFAERVSETKRMEIFDRCVPPFDVTCVEYRADRGCALEHPNYAMLVWRVQTEVGWEVNLTAFACDLRGAGPLCTTPGIVCIPVSSEGRPDWSTTKFYFGEDEGDIDPALLENCFVALLAFRFAHAHGVQMVEHRAPRHERRSADRAGKPPLVTYRTLEIKPITKRLQEEGMVDKVGLMKALHLCRGHFADYTQGAGLFGKYKTEVFVSEHWRGRRERGLVEKDYRIALPTPSGSAGVTISAGQSSSPEASAA